MDDLDLIGNPIWKHHQNNIDEGTYVRNEDGSVSTVYTTIMGDGEYEYLIPQVWDGKILEPEEAFQRAMDSGVDWPREPAGVEGVKRLERLDELLHENMVGFDKGGLVDEDRQTQEAFDATTGQAMALTPPRVEDQALVPRSEAGQGVEPLEFARPSFESAVERFRSAGAVDVDPDDPALFNAYRRSMDYLGDMALGGLDLTDAAFKAAVGIVSQALPEDQERRFARDMVSMPEAFMGYSPGRIQAATDRVAEGVGQVGRNLQQPGPMPTLGSNLGNVASGSPSPRRGPANVPRFTVRGENTALPSPTFGNMKLRDLFEEDQWENRLDLDFTAEDDNVIGFYDSVNTEMPLFVNPDNGDTFGTGVDFNLGYAPNIRVHDLADIVLGRRSVEETLNYFGEDPDPDLVNYVNTRISNLQERPEFQEYVERYRGLNEPYDPYEILSARGVTGREGSTVATFRSPIPDVLNQIEFPSAGIKGSQLLKAFQDSPSVRGSELRSLGINIDPQRRYSEEEARGLFENRLWTATAAIQESPLYPQYQRQGVLDPVVDYFELTVNADRSDAPNFRSLRSQHFNENTLSHTRASVREDSRGQYILPEEFQSDLLQQGFVPPVTDLKRMLSDRLATDLNYYPDVDWDDYIVQSNFTETLGNVLNGLGRAADYEGGEAQFHFIWNALEDLLDPATYNDLRYEASRATGEGLTIPNLREYLVPKNYAEPPIQKTEEGVRLAFDGLLAEAQNRGIDRIIIPPFERIVGERFQPGTSDYYKALQPSSGFYATYVKSLDKILKEYEKEFGRGNFNTRLVDLDYEPRTYVDRRDPNNRRVFELSRTGIEVNFKGALDAGYDFSSPRFAEGGLVQNYNSGGVVSMEEQMSLFDMGGLTDDGAMRDPVSGNDVPPGSMATEVRDDVPAMLSEGEYIVPADVVRYYGVKFFEDLRGQAKSGMMDMERNGRIGGEPVGAPEDDLTPEEMQMLAEITGMYAGGMVKGYQEGGVVDQPFTPIPNYNIPGFSMFQPTQTAAPAPAPVQTQNVTLYGPNGEVVTLTLPTDQERYNQLLGQGYTTQPRAPTQLPQAQDSGDDREDDFVFSDDDTTSGFLKPEMFDALNSDPLAFGQSMLEKKDFTRIAGGLGSIALGPFGGLAAGAISAGITANNVAQARAAVQIAKSRGLDTTELEANIDKYVEGLPNVARLMASNVTGDRIVTRFNNQLEQDTGTAPPAPQPPSVTSQPSPAPIQTEAERQRQAAAQAEANRQYQASRQAAAAEAERQRQAAAQAEANRQYQASRQAAQNNDNDRGGSEAVISAAQRNLATREEVAEIRAEAAKAETQLADIKSRASGGRNTTGRVGFEGGGLVAKPTRKKPVANKK